MKPIFTIGLIFWTLGIAQAQVVPNGGFEEWDTTTTSYPIPPYWIWFHGVPATCMVPTSMTMEPSYISSSGCCSVKLTTQSCRKGTVYSGDLNASMPRTLAVECGLRPAQLSFQYMFDPVGGDSAFVRIQLFNYDSITPGLLASERMEMVGISWALIIEQVNSFTPFNVPIQYLSADTPAFMNIQFFSSSPTSQGHVGTSLWIDDVGFTGTVGLQEELEIEAISVHPNPAGDRIWFRGIEITDGLTALVFDAKGAQVMDQRIKDPASGMDVSGLRPGLYTLVLRSRDRGSVHVAWVKE